MARFNLDFAWASAIILCVAGVACACSTSIVLGTWGPRNERSEGNSPKMSSEGTTPSGPSVSLHALTPKHSRNSFFNLG